MAKYKYRKKSQYWHTSKDSKWNTCTENEKTLIEKNSPRRFEFMETKKPKPTPSMKQDKDSNNLD